MTRVELHFFGGIEIELGEVLFSHPLLEQPVLSVRGRSPGAHVGCASFPWGAVAKALSLLMLRAKLQPDGCIEGDASSLASSLDYAISKPPVWFRDLFGCDRFGVSLARRIFCRTNPERKRPGPVRIAVNTHQLSQDEIRVKLNGVPLEQPESIRNCLHLLERSLHRRRLKEPRSSDETSLGNAESGFRSSMRDHYIREISESLRYGDLFSRSGILTEVNALGDNPSFRRLLRQPADFLSGLSEEISSKIRFGCMEQDFLDRHLRNGDRLLVWVTAVQPANYALIRFLIDVNGYNIDVDFRFNYGTEIARKTVDPDFGRGPDICFAGVGPAVHIFKNARGVYHPWLLGPTLSHATIARHDATAGSPLKGEYHLVIDEPTTASFCLDHLCRNGTLRQKQLPIHHCEPEDTIGRYASSDESFRSLLWFPHYPLFGELLGAKILRSKETEPYHQRTVGFVHERLRRDSARFAAFQAAMRDAWIRLRETPELVSRMVDVMLNDSDYTTFIERSAGVHSLPVFSPPRRAA